MTRRSILLHRKGFSSFTARPSYQARPWSGAKTSEPHGLYAYQLRRRFGWCETNGLDPLVGIQRAHVELYIRNLCQAGLMASSTNTMMHGVRGFFPFAHIDGLIPADPPSTPGSPMSTATSPAPRAWTGSS